MSRTGRPARVYDRPRCPEHPRVRVADDGSGCLACEPAASTPVVRMPTTERDRIEYLERAHLAGRHHTSNPALDCPLCYDVALAAHRRHDDPYLTPGCWWCFEKLESDAAEVRAARAQRR